MKNGECWLCGAVCTHTGGTQTRTGYACDTCGSWYGEVDADAHSFNSAILK